MGSQVRRSQYYTRYGARSRGQIYVDEVNGNDANAGDAQNPLATIIEAERRIDDIGVAPVRVNVAPGTYEAPAFRARVMRSQIDIYGTGVTELLASTPAIAGSTNVQVVTGGGLGVNTYRGKTIEILTGAAAGDRRTIRDHTDTTIVPCIRFNAAIGAGDTFRIVEPAATLTPPASWEITRGGIVADARPAISGVATAQYAVNFVNFKLDASTTIKSSGATLVRFFGCETFGGSTWQLLGGNVAIGYDAFEESQIATRLEGLGNRAWWGWGLYHPGLLFPFSCNSFACEGIVCASVIVAGVTIGGFKGGNVYDGGIWVQGPSNFGIAGKVSNGNDIPFLIGVGSGGFGLRVGSGNGGVAVTPFASLVDVSIDVGVNNAVEAWDGATAYPAQQVTIVNCGVGFKAKLGGIIKFNDNIAGSVSFTNPPSVNEIEVGNTPATTTLAALAAAVGNFLVDTPSDGSKMQRMF